MPPRRAPFVEDVLTVLIDSFGYTVENIGESGVLLVKEQAGAHYPPIQLPYGDDTIPWDVIGHVFSRADFTIDQFRTALDQYLR